MKKLALQLMTILLTAACIFGIFPVLAATTGSADEIVTETQTGVNASYAKWKVSKKYFALSYTMNIAETYPLSNGCCGIVFGDNDNYACVYIAYNYDSATQPTKLVCSKEVRFGPWWKSDEAHGYKYRKNYSVIGDSDMGKDGTVLALCSQEGGKLTVQSIYFNGRKISGFTACTIDDFNGKVGYATKITGANATVKFVQSNTALDAGCFDSKTDLPNPPQPTDALFEHLIAHYDFLGDTDEEKLSDKGTAGSDRENLKLYSTADGSGKKDSYLENGTAYISSKKSNYLIATPGGDIKGLKNAMTVFMVFQPTADQRTNPGDMFAMDNNVRFGYHNSTNALFSGLGTNFSVAGASTAAESIRLGQWIYAAMSLDWNKEAGTVLQTISYSLDGGKTYTSVSRTVSGIDVLFSNATQLLFGKVTTGIDDRGTNFCFKDIRIYDRALTESEIAKIRIQESGTDKPVDPDDPVDPPQPPQTDRDLSKHLITHYDFLGKTADEKLSDKGTAGSDRENLMMYSSIDANGKKDSYFEDGTVYISSKQSNFLFAMPGEDIRGLDGSMTVFMVFQPTADKRTNPGDMFAMDNNVRFGYHNSTNALFSGVGTSFGGGGTSTVAESVRLGQWVYAAISLDWNRKTGTVTQTIFCSLDGGKTYTSVSRTVSGIDVLFSNATYLIFGKIAPGMEDRGTNFRFKDIRIYDCALTKEELATIKVQEADSDGSDDPVNPNDPINPGNPGESENPKPEDPKNPTTFGTLGTLAFATALFAGLLLAVTRRRRKRTHF